MLKRLLVKEIVAPIIIIIVSTISYIIVSRILKKIFKVRMHKVNVAKQKTLGSLINNVVKYFIAAIAILMILEVYGIDTKSLVASLGVFSLVAGLALQDLLKDLIAGFSIILEDQFSIGDIVKIGEFEGTVIYLGLKATKIKTYSGEIKIISNRNITEVINYSLELHNTFLDIDVSYDADIEKTKKLLEDICDRLSDELKLKEKATCLGVDKLGNNSVVYRISIPTDYRDSFNISRKFKAEIKWVFDQHGIEIPYQQVVIHNEQ